MSQANKLFNQHIYHQVTSSIDKCQCQFIHEYFYKALKTNASELTKTHFFQGRYENIYVKKVDFGPLKNVLADAKQQAAKLLNCHSHELSMDFWFNHMPPKHITDWHRHDVMDERLSAVYYVTVPEQSGDLLLKAKPSMKRIHPTENDFIFFNPDIEHSVEENKSNQSRLSIGMNFGFIADKEDEQ